MKVPNSLKQYPIIREHREAEKLDVPKQSKQGR